MRRASLSPLLLALAIASHDARGETPELWRWIDADGIPRFTPDPDHVPSSQRGTLARVEAGMAKAPEPAQELKPTAIFVPPGEPALEADPFNAPAPPRVESEIVAPVPLETAPRAAAPAPAHAAAPPTAPSPAPAAARRAPAPAPRAAAAASAQASEVVPIAAIEAEEVSLDAPPPAATAPALEAPAPSVLDAPALDAAAPAAHAPALATLPAAGEVAPAAAAPVLAAAPAAPTATDAAETASDAVGAAPAVSAAPAVPAAPPAADLEARRAELSAAIARDEEALKAQVASGAALADSPELREIAQRLPALRAELRALEAQPAAP